MNILLITQFLSTTKGGGEHLFSVIANGLASSGHNIWILTHKIENEDYSNFHENVKIVFVSKIRYEGGLPPSFSDNIKFVLHAIIKGYKIIRKEKIELIHSNNFSPALTGSILSSLTGKPHLTTVHDIFSLCGKNYWKMWGKQNNVSKLNVLLAPRFEKMIIKLKHDAIHTVSEATRNDLLKFGSTKPIHVIQPGIKFPEHQEFDPNFLQFVSVGRLVFYKNLEPVIRAISIVKKSYPEIKLKIVGGGPHQENLSNLVRELKLEENIEFCGYVSEEDKFKIISSSIAMVFPSLCEGFGLVILESFSCNRPVLVSNVKPLSEIIEDKKDGLIIDAQNEERWAEAMRYLISNPSISSEMGKNGKEKLENAYNQDMMISKIETIYNEAHKTGLIGNYDHYKDQYWNNLELVQQYINQNATGNRDTIWQIDIQSRFKQYLPFKNVLVIGCGNGWVERQLYDLRIGLHFDAFDISEKYLDQAKELSQDRDIRYFKADINHLDNLGESKYDAIFNVGVLHHTFRLSHAVWKLARSLKPEGLMFNFDYIGPAHNQYSDEHLRVLKNVNSQLPKRFQSHYELRPPKRNFYFGDPSEAVHSDLVIPTIDRFFDIIYQNNLNGGVAYQILWNNINEFKKDDNEASEVLRFLLNKDKEYTKMGNVPILFWYGVGTPKPLNRIRFSEILP